MADQRLRIEAEIAGVRRHHPQSLGTLRKRREIPHLDRLQMIGMDPRILPGLVEGHAAVLALALQIPSGLSRRILPAIGFRTEMGPGGVGTRMDVHVLAPGCMPSGRAGLVIFRRNGPATGHTFPPLPQQ